MTMNSASNFSVLRGTPQMIRAAIQEHTGVEPPPRQPAPCVAAYGTVNLTQTALLMDNIEALAGSAAMDVDVPDIMEEYGQRCGLERICAIGRRVC